MKKTILFLFLISSLVFHAQLNYGHEWIDASKPHYKIPVITNNIYRIPYSFLVANCPEIASANAAEITMFFNGMSIPIYVSWSASPTSADYIEFYGKKLESEVDKKLYIDSNDILNPYTSLFRDTGYYFLTLRSGANLRYTSLVNDTTAVGVPYLNYCISNSLIQFKNNYNEGRRWYYNSTDYVYSPLYDKGEGWGTTNYASQSIPTPNYINLTGVDAQLDLRIFARNELTHQLEIKLNNTMVGQGDASGSQLIVKSFTFPSSTITSSSSNLTINPLLPNNHGYCLGSALLSYPRDFNFSGLGFYTFSLPSSGSVQKLNIANYHSTNAVILYDMVNKTRIEHTPSSVQRFIVQPQSNRSELAILHTGLITSISSIAKVDYSSLMLNQAQFLIIAHRSLQFDSVGRDVIQEYKAYKESIAGGGFKVAVVYTDDLSNLFGYGIPKHPIAIRKYLQWAYRIWTTTPPEYAMIIGKGYTANLLANASQTLYVNSLIPSFGHAASDYPYSTLDSSLYQFIPIGRLSTNNPHHVRNYLNKLKEYNAEYNATSPSDQNPLRKEYMKWYVHLGGGQGVNQQTDFRNNLKSFEAKIKDISHGARVYSVFKNGPDISQDISSVDLTNRINKGVSMITFFGHSSATIFDVGIGDPLSFTNKGKYPFFLANGCNSGFYYSSSPSYSENFINQPDKGAIGFIATTNNALDISLYSYGNSFYDNLARNRYQTSVGVLMQKTSQDILSQGLNFANITPMEFNLNGDPSVMMTQYSKPDYYIDNRSLILPSINLNTTMDSFSVKLIVQNLGKAISTPIKVRIERTNNGRTVPYEKQVNAPYFLDTIAINLPIKDEEFGIGLNTFNIKIESENVIDEISEQNNEVKNIGNLLIENDDILPIFPYDYAIVGTNTASLVAMSTQSNKPSQRYFFQIDTTPNFNSIFLKSYYSSPSTENIIKWNPLLVFQDSIVYYWRVSRDTFNGKGYRWNQSSFVYIPNQTMGGWNQSHYYQFLNDDYQNVLLGSNRKFQFVPDVKSILCRTDGSTGTYEVEWYLNNARQAALREAGRMTNGFFVIWIDGKSGIAKQSLDTIINGNTWGSYGSISFGYPGLPREGFVFQDTGKTPSTHPRPNTEWSTVFLDFVSQVPDGDYLIFYTYKKPVYHRWNASLVSYFQSAGFSGIQTLVDTIVKAPFIFGYRKNTPSFTPIANIGTDYISKTSASIFITGSWKEGYVESVKIGPSQKWQTLSYEMNPVETPSKDSNVVELYGYKSNLQRDLLMKFYSSKLDTTITWIDPNIYTQLQLKLTSSDDKDRTPTQLRFWRVYYDDIGELAVNNSSTQIPKMKDTIENGESISLYFGSETLNSRAFDTVTMKLNITQGNQFKTKNIKMKPLSGNSFDVFQTDVSYKNYFEGENIVTYEINPKDFGYQKEKYNVNNYGRMTFFVKSDKENPLLDVTFDGVHIINNELVSNKPQIRIVLKDENKYLLLNDTNILKMYLKYPDGSIRPFYFSQSNVSYTLASNTNNNRSEITYIPELVDGSYQLIIKDNDISGNSSGQSPSFDYKISFQVISKNQISQFLNYPNPFTTSTQFIFTLTGSKIPDVIKITITNIRGQVVKEINKEELGPIKFGLNRTQYAWDGRDMYGDMLANGVYLYKVTVRDNGQDYPMMEESDFKSISKSTQTLNQYFTNGWGKMVIVR